MKSKNNGKISRNFLIIGFVILIVAAAFIPFVFGWSQEPALQPLFTAMQLVLGALALRVLYYLAGPVIDISEEPTFKDGKYFLTLQSDVTVDVLEPRIFFLVRDADPFSTQHTTLLKSESLSLGRLQGLMKNGQSTIDVAIPDVVIDDLLKYQSHRLTVEVTFSERLSNHRSVICRSVNGIRPASSGSSSFDVNSSSLDAQHSPI